MNAFGISRNFLRKCSSQVGLPWDQIPGPRGIFGIGNFYNYFMFFGEYSWEEVHRNGLLNYKRYGPIVRERMIPGVHVVYLYDPKDIAEVMTDAPPNLPRRRSHFAIEKYRRDRPEIYRTGGLMPTNGDEWWKIRSELQKSMSKSKNVRNFLPLVDETVKAFMRSLPTQFDENKEIADMLEELSRLNLELTSLLAFNQRMNAFSAAQRLPDSESSRLMKAAEAANQNVLPTDQGFQLWRYIDTPTYLRIIEAQEYLEKVAVELIAKGKTQPGDGTSLLEQFIANPKIEIKDLHGSVVDLLLGGVHTTSFSMAFSLYHIAKDARVQDLMYQEALKVLPTEGYPVTPATMNSEIPYTRAVLKESLRLNPISTGVGRILNKDTILGGYLVPKDSNVVTCNLVACRLEKNFKNPMKFIPERWLKTHEQREVNVNPYLVLPFGHGMRSCIARRFAEQNMLVFLLRLMRCYMLEWKGAPTPLDLKTKLINEPDGKIALKFEHR